MRRRFLVCRKYRSFATAAGMGRIACRDVGSIYGEICGDGQSRLP